MCGRSDGRTQCEGMGLHVGYEHVLFAVVLEQLTDKIRQESLWTMMSMDDMTCGVSREQDDEGL